MSQNSLPLMERMNGELELIKWESLYGLLSFYMETVPAFIEVVEPVHKLLG